MVASTWPALTVWPSVTRTAVITPARDALTSAPAMDIRAPVAGTISLMSPTVATKVTRPDFVGASSFLAQATTEPASAAARQILSKRARIAPTACPSQK